MRRTLDLKGLPAGQYVLERSTGKLGEQTLTVTIPAKGAAKGDFYVCDE